MNTKIKLLGRLFLLSLSFTLTSCEKDLYEANIKQNKIKTHEKTLTGENAILIANKLIGFLNSKNISINQGQLKTTTEVAQSSIGTIKYDEIREIIDSLGKTNYTFRVDHPDSDYKTFFNLVFQEKGGYSSVKLIKFEMTEEFAQLYKENLKLDNFKGSVTTEVIVSDMPCPEQDFTVVIGNTPTDIGGGSDLPPHNSPNQPPPFNFHLPPLIFILPVAGGGDGVSNNETVTVVEDDPTNAPVPHYHHYYYKIAQNTSVNPGEDTPCPKDAIIGILNPIDDCSRDFMTDLPSDQKNWLYVQQTNNAPIFSEILNYAAKDENGCSKENRQLMNEVINQIFQNPNVFFSIKPFLIEKNIDDSQLDDCTKGILNNLKQNHAIAKIIARFDNPDSSYKLNIIQGVIPSDPAHPNQVIFGQTTPIVGHPFEYQITLNSSQFNSNGPTNLFKAKTIIHEMIHALILSIIDSRLFPNGNTDPTDFPEIWNNYIAGKFNGEINATHHLFIGNNYVNIISQALQEYYPNDQNLQASIINQMCTDIAWSGLLDLYTSTPTPFDSQLTPTDKARIANRIMTEVNKSDSFGLPLSSSNPCAN